MFFTRCIYKVSLIGNFLYKNNVWETNFKIFQRKSLIESVRKAFLNYYKTHSENSSIVKEPTSALKKRLIKKKKPLINEEKGFLIMAFSTAEEYYLEKLPCALQKYTAFEPTKFGSDFANSLDVVHAKQNSEFESECQDLFFFREGCVVMWNISDFEIKKILNFLKFYENNSFVDDVIQNESEIMTYSVSENIAKTKIYKNSLILCNNDNLLDKYAISNAMALSVLLGSYEANLEQYIETMEPVTEDLKAGKKIRMSRSEVLQKTGQLFAFRHNINLNSDLLDTPDFYWDREELESLYQSAFNYYCINKRTRVINEKISHCIELVDLLSSHLNDKHHIRLEWMIIILIMVEVAFEIFHCLKYFEVFRAI